MKTFTPSSLNHPFRADRTLKALIRKFMNSKFQAELSLESIPRSTHYVGSLSFKGEEYAVQCHGRDSGLKVMLAKTQGENQDLKARESFIPSRTDRHSPKLSTGQLIGELPKRLSKMHPALRGVSIKVSG